MKVALRFNIDRNIAVRFSSNIVEGLLKEMLQKRMVVLKVFEKFS